MRNKQSKLVFVLAVCTVIGCAQKKTPVLDELTATKIKLDMARLQSLQAQADPIVKDFNEMQEKIKRDYPGYKLDPNTLALIPTDVAPAAKK